MAKTAERLEQDGKKIGVIDILTTPESRNAFIANLVRSFRQQAPPNKKQEYLAEVLNGKLEGSKGSALVTRVLIEDFIENAYYRVRIGRGHRRLCSTTEREIDSLSSASETKKSRLQEATLMKVE
jgi:hypothetical protein